MVFAIGNVKLENNLVLAPMYRYSDLAFRLLCRGQGVSLCYSEMINSEALIRNNLAAQRLAVSCKEDRPLGMQVFGARVESMCKAAEILVEKHDFDFLDLNLGCPSGNVLNQGAGYALLKRPKRIEEIISCWAGLGKPVTAKMRSGQNVLHSIRIAKEIERAGASAIAVHGRTAKQENKGVVDFVAIKRIKKAVGIPVIGNGGVNGKAGFERMLEKTGCDAVMVGGAAIGNPGIFAEILGREHISSEQAFFKYLELCEKHGTVDFGRLKVQSTKFFSGRKETRIRLEKAGTLEKLVEIAKQGLGNA